MEEKAIILGIAGSDLSVSLADREAANVLGYRYVVPFVRIKQFASMDPGGGVRFQFRTAALLAYPEEPNRFATPAGWTNLDILSSTLTAGGGATYPGSVIIDPGALLSCTISQINSSPAASANFVADIYLVCREA